MSMELGFSLSIYSFNSVNKFGTEFWLRDCWDYSRYDWYTFFYSNWEIFVLPSDVLIFGHKIKIVGILPWLCNQMFDLQNCTVTAEAFLWEVRFLAWVLFADVYEFWDMRYWLQLKKSFATYFAILAESLLNLTSRCGNFWGLLAVSAFWWLLISVACPKYLQGQS